jgi:hypothetical protein
MPGHVSHDQFLFTMHPGVITFSFFHFSFFIFAFCFAYAICFDYFIFFFMISRAHGLVSPDTTSTILTKHK